LKILVVEDNPSDVGLLREAFRELNSRVTIIVARDGEECLEMMLGPSALSGRDLPHLIFLDLSLPMLSGYEVLKRLKNDDRTRHIPIIVLSSVRADEAIERAYEEYANAFVHKPTTLEGLMSAARGLSNFWLDTARLANQGPTG
jgi:CheY-like chemotaxis protein